MADVIKVPQVTQSDYLAVEFATEVAFTALYKQVSKQIPLDPVMGFVYLPKPEVVEQFKEACRAVVEVLRQKKV